MSAIQLDGVIFVVMGDGKFGQIEIDKHGDCHFSHLSESKTKNRTFRYLYQN